jgi:hypothetical protein
MRIVKTRYENEILITPKTVVPDGFSCISFQNVGDVPAVVMDNIVLPVSGDERNFSEAPGVVIHSHFPVTFTGAGDNPGVLVVKTYYDLDDGIQQ